MKKMFTRSVMSLVIIVVSAYFLMVNPFNDRNYSEENPEYYFSISNKTIQILEDGKWEDFEIKGVNMGSGYPGAFPNDDAIDKETYLKWFEMIGKMNANVIRVYKLQSPEFYSALYKYNKTAKDKVYLIQNIDFSNEVMYSEENILEEKLINELYDNTKHVIDAVHGKRVSMDLEKDSMNLYMYDVSEYILGYIFGIEWDSTYISYISNINDGIEYTGDYMYSSFKASPFEVFLAKWSDMAFSYELEKYHMQHLISYANWAETDPFINKLQLAEENNIEVTLDIENIKHNDNVKTGIFASYNIYPYYPEFLQYGQYARYKDDKGRVNPYRKYLMDLVEYHEYPVVVTEFGVPSSRSIAHGEIWRDYSHGGLNEIEQAEAVADLYNDIKKSGCAGAMIFSWQDEWYKKAWNEKALSDSERIPYWNNVQSAEQFFGILSFESGKENSDNYPDGDTGEWENVKPVFKTNDTKLSIKNDEKYLYILAEGLDMRSDKNYINIALDIAPHIGDKRISETNLNLPADFIIQLCKNDNSALYVNKEYDVLIHSVMELYNDKSVGGYLRLKNKYAYKPVMLNNNTNFVIVSRPDNENYKDKNSNTRINEVGRLKLGNGNPKSREYDSNADYYIFGNTAEIRIPWQLLNFTDPSKCEIINDFEETDYSIEGRSIKNIHVASFYDDNSSDVSMGVYKLNGWDKPSWHERKKQVYYTMQKEFKEE